MPVSNKYNCLFIHIPKTGGTSIESALEIFGDWKIEDKEMLFGLIQSPEIKTLNFTSDFLQHLTLQQAKTLKPELNNQFSFSFVRNPWDKMVSIYSNPDNNLVETALEKGINLRNLSFEEFIIQTAHIKHSHLEPQHTYICDDNDVLRVSFLGKFESLQEDFKRLCEILNSELALPHKNQSERKNYQNYYSTKSKKIVENRYQKDINLFDYTF